MPMRKKDARTQKIGAEFLLDANRDALKSTLFHHPDISWPIVRRSATELLLATAAGVFGMLVTRGRSLLWTAPDERLMAYRSAQRRLFRAGWIAYRRADGGPPVLAAAPTEAQDALPPFLRPESRWNRRWRGTWWVLSYDVPESNRMYRRHLSAWTRRLGMGRLQESLWVSPDDVRPEYRDMDDAAAVTEYAVLFEARTVLGMPDRDIARRAWSMNRLADRQQAFAQAADRTLERVRAGRFSACELRTLREEAYSVYADVMSADPLLPRALWPGGYAGELAYQRHAELQRTILGLIPGRFHRRRRSSATN